MQPQQQPPQPQQQPLSHGSYCPPPQLPQRQSALPTEELQAQAEAEDDG